MGHETAVEAPAKKNWYTRIPLYVKIIIALICGAILGNFAPSQGWDMEKLKWISDLVLRMLRTLATPLIFSAVLGSIIGANVSGKKAGKLMWLLMTNSVVAIIIGLGVANLMQPGQHLRDHMTQGAASDKEPYNIWQHLFDSVPTDFITPFQKNDIISILVLAISLGVAMRILLNSPNEQVSKSVKSLQNVLNALFQIVIIVLKWVFELVPVAVFAVVARVVGKGGFEALAKMSFWIGSVVSALVLMVIFYLIRMMITARVNPIKFLRGGSDAFAMAFSTASSAATLPVTYRCATEKLGIKPDNANMGIMVGGTFNHDGTALYEAMAALLIAQGLGQNLSLPQQVVVVFMAIIASVGAAGIPEAGLVTMIAVFHAVNLPIEYIPMLLTVDWLLDRCRTTVNVMGDLASTCILDAKE